MTNVQKFEATMTRMFSYSTKALTPTQLIEIAESFAASAGLTQEQLKNSLAKNLK